MPWEKSSHPRGGNSKNSGQFSSYWGTEKAKAERAKYSALARTKYDELAGDRKDYFKRNETAARMKYMELTLKEKSGKKLSAREQREVEWSKARMLRDSNLGTVAGVIGGAAGVSTYLGVNTAMVTAGAGGAPFLAVGAVGAGTAHGMRQHLYNQGKGEILGVRGFKRDGVLSEAESNSITAAVTLLGIGVAGALDAKIGTNAIKITRGRIRPTAVTKNLVPSPEPVVQTTWAQSLGLGSASPAEQVMKWAKHNGATASPQQIRREFARSLIKYQTDLTAAGVDDVSHAYHGNPFKDAGPRAFQFNAEKALSIQDAQVSHFQLSGLVTHTIQTPKQKSDQIKSMQLLDAATQEFFKRIGLTHVDVTRGMALSKTVMKRHGVKPIESLDPTETPWVRGSIKLQPLNSFSTQPQMAVDYATNSVGGIGTNWGSGNIAMIVRARVPVERVYGFTGFGPGHGSEIVIKGGWLDDVEIMVVDPQMVAANFRRITGNLGAVRATNDDTSNAMGRLWDWMSDQVTKRAMSEAEIRRRKKLQGTISHTTGALGLTGATIGTAAVLGSKKPGALKAIRRVPGMKKTTVEGLKDAGLYTGLASGGIGGAGAFNFAAYTNAESKRKKPIVKSVGIDAPMFGEEGIAKSFDETLEKTWAPMGRSFDAEERRVKRQQVHQTVAGATAAAAGFGSLRQLGRSINLKEAQAKTVKSKKKGAAAQAMKIGRAATRAKVKAAGYGAVGVGATVAATKAIPDKKKGSWQPYSKSDDLSKALGDWKTIDQREQTQRRDRKGMRAAGGAAGVGVGLGVLGYHEGDKAAYQRSGKNLQVLNNARKTGHHDAQQTVRGLKIVARNTAQSVGTKAKVGGALIAGATAVGAPAKAHHTYQQHKINGRRRANYKASLKKDAASAFGVVHD